MKFIKSNSIKIELLKEQEMQLSSRENIKKELEDNVAIAFDIYDGDNLIGFAMLRKYSKGYFLWNFAIDHKFQNKGYGTKALVELSKMLKEQYGANEISTTYLWGNEHAKYVYEKVGFIETDVVDEEDVHEVNMVCKLKK